MIDQPCPAAPSGPATGWQDKTSGGFPVKNLAADLYHDRQSGETIEVLIGQVVIGDVDFTVWWNHAGTPIGEKYAHDFTLVRKESAMLQCKFRVGEISKLDGPARRLKLYASNSKEGDNQDWSKHTPSGCFEFVVTNSAAFERIDALNVGDVFYIDLSRAAA